jgi:glycosyltransferase involved in cell wall biosynthesis
VVGCGVTPSEFEGISTAEARVRLGLPLDKPVIGFIGQIGNHKGIDTLMKAMPCVWESHPDVHLVIAGSRAMFAEKLDNIISDWPEEYQKKLHIFYNFPESDKPYLFNALDIFTYPSGFESFGIAYLEAWASKKPVIGTWNGAIPWVVSAGRDGLLVNFGYRDQLAQAIILLIKYPEWARELGEAGYQKVLRQYTWHQVAQRVREGYEHAIQQHR